VLTSQGEVIQFKFKFKKSPANEEKANEEKANEDKAN
jgi:hypothetical protein